MKKILLIFLIIVPGILCAQSKKVKLYAYQQKVLPGINPVTIDESGTTKEIPKKTTPTRFIYVEVPPGKEMQWSHLWIDGIIYDINTVSPSLPVVIANPNVSLKGPDTLVRNTSNRVVQLVPVEPKSQFTPSSKAKKKMKSNQVVLHTIEKGKNCYYYLDKIKNLDPVALQ